jgi:hypothetical protein
MPIDPVKLAALLLIRKPAVCEYLSVEWDKDDANETRYYGAAAYHEMGGYIGRRKELCARSPLA